FFFFQAEDGIRDKLVTGVQTCALPISVVSARGQLLTIATERGDITRVAPDNMASRSSNPKWSADGKWIAYVSDRSGRDEVWVTRSEERRVGKGGGSWWSPDGEQKDR